MNTTIPKTTAVFFLIVSLVLGLCGCGSENQNRKSNGLKLSPIYGAALGGAIIGGIIGHQSHETGEGVAIGAAVLGVGELLRQTDKLSEKEQKRESERKAKDAEQVVIEIQNDNGSVTPVKLKKKGSIYIGPKGERYDGLPTEEQLKPIYGL